jgi:hypothetical protein
MGVPADLYNIYALVASSKKNVLFHFKGTLPRLGKKKFFIVPGTNNAFSFIFSQKLIFYTFYNLISQLHEHYFFYCFFAVSTVTVIEYFAW